MAGMVMTGAGCLLSPDIEQEPAEQLYPPQILLDSLYPSLSAGIIDLDSDCNPATFRVGTVRDYNRRDTLYARWLLDWREDGYSSIWPTAFIHPIPSSTDRPGLETTINIAMMPIDSVHSLRFFVADRPPLSDGNGMQMPADSEGQIDWVQWTFRIAPAGSGICAQEPLP